MGEENKVTLHGMWLSPYVKRVELALKVKGIPFEYIEEDLSNKSPLILKYNPIHKKVPILVHNGKPVNESFVIVEYIDETWKNGPQLLPEDPYERSKVRFWAAYIQQVMESMLNIFTAEDQKQACNEFHQKFRLLEDGMKNFFPKIENRNIGLIDIWIVVAFGMCKAQEEAFGVNFLDPEKVPLIHSWVNSLLELPLLKETVPNHDKAVSFLRALKETSTKGQAHRASTPTYGAKISHGLMQFCCVIRHIAI